MKSPIAALFVALLLLCAQFYVFCLTENFADQQKKLRENIAAKITVHDLVKLLRNRHTDENETGEVAVSKNTSWKELIGVAAGLVVFLADFYLFSVLYATDVGVTALIRTFNISHFTIV